MNKKGQGALEYLLLIGGAVLVAVIVIVLLLGVTNTGKKSTAETTAGAICRDRVALGGATATCTTVTSGAVTTAIAPIKVENYTCTCSGTYPNCVALCV